MSHFIDRDGRRWDVCVNLMTARKIKVETGINVRQLFSQETLELLSEDDAKVMDILWICVEAQADKREHNFEEFYTEVMDSDLIEQALDRFFDAVVEFLPEEKRQPAKKLLSTLRKIGEKTTQRALLVIDDIDVDKDSERIANAIATNLMIGPSSTNFAESSESTQAKAD